MTPDYECDFVATLRRVSGDGGWVFATVPDVHAPTVALGWGRTPVQATVDGTTWSTSVWRSRKGVTELAVPKRVPGRKDDGDEDQAPSQRLGLPQMRFNIR